MCSTSLSAMKSPVVLTDNATGASSSAVASVPVSSKLGASELLSILEGLGSSVSHISCLVRGSHVTLPGARGVSTAESNDGGFTR